MSHLIVLHHGFWGVPAHVSKIQEILEKQYSNHSGLVFLNIKSSPGFLTYDGIDICGDRAVEDIQEYILQHEKPSKISFIGYSMGGLVLRYAIGKLESLNFFESVQPMNYTSFATPHLGTAKPHTIVSGRLMNRLQQNALVRLGKQFTMTDDYLDGHSLLVIMSLPSSPFYKGLARFQKRSLFANSRNDFTVRFTTAAIEHSNPYTKQGSTHLYPDEYPSIVTPSGTPRKSDTWKSREIFWASIGIVLSPVLVPLWFSFLTVFLGTHAIKASKRQAELVYDSSWIQKLDPPTNQNPSQQRQWVVDQLNTLEWEKIHASIRFTNSHAAIVGRRAGVNDRLDTLEYFAQKVFLI